MTLAISNLVVIVLTFVLAGGVKGITGMGLPTVAIGLLALVMAPAEAAALLVIPSLVTNAWQFLVGAHRLALLRRMWPMLIAIGVATWASAGLIAGNHTEGVTTVLGMALVVYAVIGLARVQIAVSPRAEPWLSPAVGAITGVVTGATGVFVIPAVPYLQALGLQRDDLVQALGLSFTASTIALAAGLASHAALHFETVGASILCTAPALAGMFAGQWARVRVDPAAFRVVFFLAMALLGGDLILRSLL